MTEIISHLSDLPDSYGETRVVLLPVGPYSAYVYWEVTPDELEKVRHRVGDGHRQLQATLRVNDVSKLNPDGMGAGHSFDVHIDLKATGRYVNLRSPDRLIFVELGFKTEEGRFFSLARSNTARTPPDCISFKADEQYMLVTDAYTFQTTEKSRFKSQELPDQGIPVQVENQTAPDLTEMCDKLFVSGISSKPSRPCQ